MKGRAGKKVRKAVTGIFISAMAVMLSGCSLAKENAGEENQDRFIGVFITNEYLDIPDRMYASVDKGGRDSPVDWEITFPGTEGLCFFSTQFSESGEVFHTIFDNGICDTVNHYSVTDTGDVIHLEGTVYALPQREPVVWYSNPVYQTDTGDIYLTAGTGVSNSTVGATTTQTLENEWTVTENGLTKTDKISVKMNFILSYPPTSIRVHQMDENNQIVKTEEYAPGSLPERLEAEEKTSYILVETQWANSQNPGVCTRELYEGGEMGDLYFETLYVAGETRLTQQTTEIVW